MSRITEATMTASNDGHASREGPAAPPSRARAALRAFLLMLPLAVLAGYLAYSQRTAVAEAASERLTAEAAAAARYFSGVLASNELAFRVLSTNAAIAARQEPACSQELAGAIVALPGLANMALADRSGNIVCSALPSAGPVNIADRSYFSRARDTREFAVGDYIIGRISGRPAVVVALPLFTSSGEFDGELIASVDLAALDALRKEVAGPAGATTLLVGSDGIVLYRNPDAEGLAGKRLADVTMDRLHAGAQSGQFIGPGADGVKRHNAFAALPSFQLEQAPFVVVNMPRSEVLKEPNRDFVIFIAVTAFVLVAGVSLAFLFALRTPGVPATVDGPV